MNLKNFSIKKIYIDNKVVNSEITKNVISKLPEVPYEIIDSLPFEKSSGIDKKILYLTENRSNFLKKCPGTPRYICCLYNVLHIAEHCPMECSYCILQVYFNNPYLTIFTNLDKMLEELKEADNKGDVVRVGSGEFTDSFALEPFGMWNEILIPFFSKCKNMFIELKSKLADRDFLKFKNHNRRTIISFSVNTNKVHNSEEFLSSDMEERIKVAKEAFENGFINSFHFDPIIDYEGCEKDYEEVINLIFDNIPDDNICWISLGSLRFIPMLKDIATKRFPETKIYYDEFHTGLDGKNRYFIERRIELYKDIVKYIKKRSKTTPLYFCMENNKVWKKVFGYSPKDSEDLSDFLDCSVKNVAKNY